MVDDDVLMRDCTVVFGRSGGPGGQHRNKVDTAAAITHTPTGIIGTASERREQHVNRAVALRRLRIKLAIEIRRNVHRDLYQPSDLWKSRRQGKQMSINHKHHDYPALLAEALDVIVARGCDVAGAAGVLGISMSQLGKLIRHNKHAFTRLNEGRAARGLKPLRK